LERNPVHGTGTKITGALRLSTVAGLLLLHGCALLAPEPEPEPVEPVPQVVEAPEPVVEVPEPEPEPEPPVVKPAPPPRQVAIVLSSRQEAYEAVANELSERLDNVAIYDLRPSGSALICGYGAGAHRLHPGF
jgi:outer membrane biosynthesis protein TonB